MNRYLASLALALLVLGACDTNDLLEAVPTCDNGAVEVGQTASCSVPGGCRGTRECVYDQDTKAGAWTECTASRIGQACGSAVGECRPGIFSCESGTVQCAGPGYVAATSELCDQKDNDCDGRIDEMEDLKNTVEGVGLGIRWSPLSGGEWSCYQGPEETRDVGACHSGVARCLSDGAGGFRLTCSGSQLPTRPQCGVTAPNGQPVDANCDRLPDEFLSGRRGLSDWVVVLDHSGSLWDSTRKLAILEGLDRWMETLETRPEYGGAAAHRVSVLTMPGAIAESDGRCMVRYSVAAAGGIPSPYPLMPTAEARYLLGQIGGEFESLGSEPTWDCPYMVAHPINPLRMNFRAGSSRAVIQFTDEHGQSYPGTWPRQPTDAQTQESAAAMLVQEGVTFHSFDLDEYSEDFAQMVTQTGGRRFRIPETATEATAALDSLLTVQTCQ